MTIRKSISNLRRPNRCERFVPVTLLGTSALMPVPGRRGELYLRFPGHPIVT